MNETEDDFVRHTRQQREALRFDKSSFDEKRCREIYRRTRGTNNPAVDTSPSLSLLESNAFAFSCDATARQDQLWRLTSLSYKPENRSAARSLRTAIASAFLWPTRTTNLLPRVIAV